jgi:hypothetical protein
VQQSQLSRTIIHKITDLLMPENCRIKLQKAFVDNRSACNGLIQCIDQNEHQLIAALKHDRRGRERKA